MKNSLLPFKVDWRQKLTDLRTDVKQRLDNPWLKAGVLLILFAIFSRPEVSFSLSINGMSEWISVVESNTIQQLGVAQPVALRVREAHKREWTEKELRQLAYVRTYAPMAVKEMYQHGIPASVTLAQGLLESNVGKSRLATNNNNHFGIKCFSKSCKKGHCSNFSDDTHKDFFLVYKDAGHSYRDHSRLLQKDRYAGLFKLEPDDYRAWSHGLRKAGYATDPRYADKLIGLIEALELDRYDEL
ncbi:MAG: glucosaminidase domain-containing protein [Saprospiraceae bacterium]